MQDRKTIHWKKVLEKQLKDASDTGIFFENTLGMSTERAIEIMTNFVDNLYKTIKLFKTEIEDSYKGVDIETRIFKNGQEDAYNKILAILEHGEPLVGGLTPEQRTKLEEIMLDRK